MIPALLSFDLLPVPSNIHTRIRHHSTFNDQADQLAFFSTHASVFCAFFASIVAMSECNMLHRLAKKHLILVTTPTLLQLIMFHYVRIPPIAWFIVIISVDFCNTVTFWIAQKFFLQSLHSHHFADCLGMHFVLKFFLTRNIMPCTSSRYFLQYYHNRSLYRWSQFIVLHSISLSPGVLLLHSHYFG